jgi:hypothetical protein
MLQGAHWILLAVAPVRLAKAVKMPLGFQILGSTFLSFQVTLHEDFEMFGDGPAALGLSTEAGPSLD